jgi:archaellum biogenesis ATPase FlaH
MDKSAAVGITNGVLLTKVPVVLNDVDMDNLPLKSQRNLKKKVSAKTNTPIDKLIIVKTVSCISRKDEIEDVEISFETFKKLYNEL